MSALRSFLYVPGNRPALFAKAEAGPADAIILDLEDAVPLLEKDAARTIVGSWLRERAGQGKPVWVRINPGESGIRDVEAIDDAGVSGIVVAKAELADVQRVRAALAPQVGVSPLLETPSAIFDARAIAAMPGVSFLQIGEYDLAAEVGMTSGLDESELLWSRSGVVFASAAGGITAPLAPVSVEIADLDRFEATTRSLARLGFVGRACIHPSQVPVVNAVFTPSDEAVATARRALELYARAHREGAGVVQDENGRLVDEATIRSSRSVLALAGIAVGEAG